MKKLALLLALCAPLSFSQQEPQPAPQPPPKPITNLAERVATPSYTDMYCAGFITKAAYTKDNRIVGGADSPVQTQFHQGDIVFLEGSGYQEGSRLAVVRALRDPNKERAFLGQVAAIAQLGQPYADLGRLRVTAIRGKTAIAEVEFSCSTMVAGDLVVPFQEKPPLPYRSKMTFERFPAGQGSVTGRVVLAKDFDYLAGTSHKVYISVGADKGVKVGDYFRAVRNYDPGRMADIDALSGKIQQSEETQMNAMPISAAKYAELPQRALAEMIVLTVTPTSSTAMITYALEAVTVGDSVELEGAEKQ